MAPRSFFSLHLMRGEHEKLPWPSGVDLACLHGDQSDWSNRTVVVPAVYKEWHGHGPPDWLARQYSIFLFQRRNSSADCYIANKGFESGVYLKFIAQHYLRLPAFVAFMQGDWIFATKSSAGHPFKFWQPHCAGGAAAGQPWSDYMPLGGRRSIWPPRCVTRQLSWYGRLVGGRNGIVVEACARELLRLLEWPGTVRPYNRSHPLNITFYTNMNFLASRQRLRRYTHRAYRQLATRFLDDGVCIPSPRSRSTGGGGGGDGGGGGGAADAVAASSSGVATTALSEMSPASLLAASGIVDTADFAKVTLGMATEVCTSRGAHHSCLALQRCLALQCCLALQRCLASSSIAALTVCPAARASIQVLQQAIFGDSLQLENGPAPAVPADGAHCATPDPRVICSIGS